MQNVSESKLSKIDKEIENIAGDLSSLTKYLYKGSGVLKNKNH